ncbi:glycoside hydrolase family 99-like domain-containing protein [Aminobacter aminovorans]|uniref:glycoside hydrolase family 99-like domain-containing protein n=1 Tax=Aminobacter aminovorans TaxID=83263 RepID=UPI002856BCBC|nr:glycoside hydrolase family 99-like domain-containing protein [Aminobacter aminovorans]MDR7222764.1 glycosyltransferase involved in cell wall biosynthesis/SAM-dependent methyltransferase [Aminobacter aminovorans]
MDDNDHAVSNLLGQFAFPNPEKKFQFTGERYVTGLAGPIQHEHYHRYLFAAPYCRDRSVLDIACGEGYGCHLLAQIAGSVVGVDIDGETIRYAQGQYASSRLRFEIGDATAIPLPAESVDIVTSFETIEHFSDHEKFLAEVARVLRPGGLLIISSPNRPIYSEENQHSNPFHARELDREEFRSALQLKFANVVLFEQRSIDGSVIIAETPARTQIEGFDSPDGLAYGHYSGVPSPHYFVAVASMGELPDVASSLLFSGAYLGSLHSTIEELNKRIRTSEGEIATLKVQLDRAQRQAGGLRAALEQWRAGNTQADVENVAVPMLQSVATVAQPDKRRRRSLPRRLSDFWRRWRTKREFDAAYYIRQNPDVAAAGFDPFRHYLRTGWREGRDPTSTFSTSYYLENYPDVVARGVNPFVHYISKGRAEGRRPNALVELDEAPVVPVPLLTAAAHVKKPARVIAFYLPQFHAIPENDQWWGKGFTEWTNVRAAEPQFKGHYQPHVPGDLGYYNLLDPAVQRRQIELAKLYGVEGFCFYFYWFGGKRLLEKPVENWLNDKSLDLPFCLCWANENWTRRWDGLDAEILIDQKHSPEDDIAFIAEVVPYLRDPRYIRVDGKPLLLVYRPSELPSAKQTAQRWRKWCIENGIGDIHLAYTQSFEQVDPSVYGFDAAIEFPPNRSHPPDMTQAVTPLHAEFSMKVYDWRVFKERSESYGDPGYSLYRTVCPGWDNTARRKNAGTAFINNTPELYRGWLADAVKDTKKRFTRPDQRLIFVNAWNEWAEGAHLEPDARYGYAWLQATRDALEGPASGLAAGRPRVVVVSHDAHPHGAQYLALNMARTFGELGFDTDMIVLGDGPLLARFAEVAKVHRIDLNSQSEAEVVRRLGQLLENGAEVAIANTTVSGLLVPLLKRAGFRTVALVHELPGILNSYKLQNHARAIAGHADKVVFAARQVQDGFIGFVGNPVEQAVIRPQGLYQRTPFRRSAHVDTARRTVREKLNFAPDASIVLGVGYGDHRKGFDLFVDACMVLMASDRRACAVWVGNVERQLMDTQMKRIRSAGLANRFAFTGLVEKPQEYYAAADVYALTSREDPFPSVVLEALDVEIPVVAFDGAGGFTDLLVRGCGHLVPPFDTDAMAADVAKLLNEPQRSAELGRNGRAIVEREFSFRHYLDDLMAFAGNPLPRVSVVVPNYNYARYISKRLASIAAQTVVPYELIVLDDASTDASVAAIDEFLADCPIPSTLIVNRENSGSVFRQWQRGVEMARGDFVWIAEADDLADPEFLSELLPAFARADVVMSYCQSRQIDGGGKVLSEDYLDYVADIDVERWTKPYVTEGREEIARSLHVKNTIPNVSAVLFRRDALQAMLAAHGDEITSFRHAGDWVAYLRLLESGALAFSPKSRNSHRRHQGSVTVGNFNLGQLREIVQVQRDTTRRFQLGASAKLASERYAQRLYEQFGLATSKHPRFDLNPEMSDVSGRGP